MKHAKFAGMWQATASVVVLLAGLTAAPAVEPAPDWVTMVFPTMVPKGGNPNYVPPDLQTSLIRYAYETRFENYWKETSYYRHDPATGAKMRGAYSDTKTFGFVQMPWSLAARAAQGAFVQGTGLADTFDPAGHEGTSPDGARNQASGLVGSPRRLYSDTAFSSPFYFYVRDAADTDAMWTPGEAFNDANNNGQWDPPQPAEDFWDSDNTTLVGAQPNAYNPRNNNGAWSQYGGEMFADYNDNNAFTRAGLTIWIDNGAANVGLPINELDLSPDAASPNSNEGDFTHVIVTNSALPMPYAINPFPIPGAAADGTTIPPNGYLDATSDADGGLQVVDTGLFIEYQAWVTVNAGDEAAGFYQWADVLKNTSAPTTNHAVRTVRAALFQSRELYGTYKSGIAAPANGVRVFGDLRGPNNSAQNPTRRISDANDGQATAAGDGEVFEDFVSAYDPVAGRQVFVSAPADGSLNGNLSAARGNTLANGSVNTRGRGSAWDYTTYTNYLAWNYPGDAAALIARCFNGRYDGPDGWGEGVSGKYVWNEGSAVPLTTPEPISATVNPLTGGLIWPSSQSAGWDPRGGYGTWGEWYMEVFGGGVTPGPAWREGIPAVSRYTPNSGRAENGWIPATSWGYDSPAEYCDMPSAIYHLEGDFANGATFLLSDGTPAPDPFGAFDPADSLCMINGNRRLGETTSPWNNLPYGHDVTGPVPNFYGSPDDLVASAGPYCFNTKGGSGFDGANQLTIEFLTHRRSAPDADAVHPRQFRDTNCDGYLDGGRELSGEENYSSMMSTASTGGGSGIYSWHRYMEDVIALWDQSENFAQIFDRCSASAVGAATRMYAYPIYPTEGANDGWAALGGPAGQVRPFLSRDTNATLAVTFQVRPLNGGGEVPGTDSTWTPNPNWDPSANPAVQDYGMALLTHEQGHDLHGWPDLYDYDVWQGGAPMINTPVASYDLMAGGGLVHGLPDLKVMGGNVGGPWIALKDLPTAVPLGAGPVTLQMYPIEQRMDQYYRLTNPAKPGEYFDLWYTDVNSDYGVGGGRGIYVAHMDMSDVDPALPIQQKMNNHFTWEIVQADGRTDLQDGLNGGDAGDPFPGTRDLRMWTEDTVPAARWWDETGTGFRIVNIVMPPAGSDLPAQVTLERYDPAAPWNTGRAGADSDNDGLSDAWEFHFFDGLTVVDGTSDHDLDGLSDMGEFMAGTDPKLQDSNGNGVKDGQEDADGDSLSNVDEMTVHGTDPGSPDTDDDGFGDLAEMQTSTLKHGRRLSSPVDSRSPQVDRSMVLDGGAGLVVPGVIRGTPDRFDLGQWSAEAWVRLATTNETGSVVERVTAAGRTNFALRIVDNVPEASFTTDNGETVRAGGTVALTAQEWVHVAAAFDPTAKALYVYVNGRGFRGQTGTLVPARGDGTTVMGRALNGHLDEVRIWSSVRTDTDVRNSMMAVLNRPWAGGYVGLLANYRFDDGENSTSVNALTGQVERYGAEDYAHRLDWTYALPGVQFAEDQAMLLYGVDDEDGDGMADSWEDMFFGAAGAPAGGDNDGDGLSNLYEFYCDTNPQSRDTDNNGRWDGDEDFDADVASNIDEQTNGTDPRLKDTDDDGVSDGTEFANRTGGTDSLAPVVNRVLFVNGQDTSYVELPDQDRFSLPTWSVEARVYPTNFTVGAVVLAREVEPSVHNYWLMINSNGTVSAGFTPADGGADVMITTPAPIGREMWTHLHADFSAAIGRLAIRVDGVEVIALATVRRPAVNGTGPVRVLAGRGMVGYIDEVRIWSVVSQLALSPIDLPLFSGQMAGLVSYLRFDDGTSFAPAQGTSQVAAWRWGQVEDFAQAFDWQRFWRDAATLRGGARISLGVSRYDTDRDGLPDDWETDPEHLLDPNSAIGQHGASGDPDGDGLTNMEEFINGTNPRKADTDGDGISDADELKVAGTDPLSADSDGDGMTDGWERDHGLNPLNPADRTGDPDRDLLNNGTEFLHNTDPYVKDTDGDGYDDGFEVNTTGTDAANWDTDLDLSSDKDEAARGTNPLVWDTDGDGLPDGDERVTYGSDPTRADSDGDGVNDLDEAVAGTVPTNAASVLRTQVPAVAGADILVRWPSVAHRRYKIEWATNAATPYSVLATNLNATPPLNTYRHRNAATFSNAIYRVSATASNLTYMIIDLSGGPLATNYPVSYTEMIDPTIFATSPEYRTTRLVLRRIPTGKFTRGSPDTEIGRYSDENVHEVTLSRPYYAAVFEVTQVQWFNVMGANPSGVASNYWPVDRVSWMDVRGGDWPAGTTQPTNSSFIGLLREKTGLALDLPTEAQWEFACRATTTNAYNMPLAGRQDCLTAAVGATDSNLDPLAWYKRSPALFMSDRGVGLKQGNNWRMHDMHGGVFEWCLDWYTNYPAETVIDPVGPVSNTVARVIRGGAWNYEAGACRSAKRGIANPTFRVDYVGFRVVAPAQ